MSGFDGRLAWIEVVCEQQFRYWVPGPAQCEDIISIQIRLNQNINRDNSDNIINENIETFLEASIDIGLEINAKKTKYIIKFRHQNSEQNQNIRIGKESFEKLGKFKYLGTTLTNQNDIHDGIKSTLIRGILAIIQSKIFFLPVSYKKTKD
jgi:hypothetical protein